MKKNSRNLISHIFLTINHLFMKKIIPHISIFLISIFSAFLASSQADRFAYAITDITKEGSNWSFLRKLDLQTGKFSDVILNGTDAAQPAYDEASKKQLTEPFQDPRYGKTANAAFEQVWPPLLTIEKANGYFTHRCLLINCATLISGP